MLRRVFLLVTVCFFISFPGEALEIGTNFSLSNMNFSPDRSPAEKEFSPRYLPLEYSAYIYHSIDDGTGISAGFHADRILKNMAYGLFTYSSDYFVLQGGPFVGVYNTKETLINPGIIAAVTLQIPGKFFFELDTTRNLALQKIFTGRGLSPGVNALGDYIQEDNKIALGFYASNTIVSFSVRSRIYSEMTRLYGEVTDSLTDYTMSTDIFQKNAPFKPMISFTYRSLSKHFSDLAPRSRHTAGSLILGTRVDLDLHRHLSAYINLDSGFYTFGLDELIGEFGGSTFFFTGTMGVRLDLDLFK